MPIVTIADLQSAAKTVTETALALTSKINSAQAGIDRSIELNIGPAPMLASRRAEYDQAASQIRRAIMKESDGHRWDALRAMSDAETEALAAETQFSSPSMILARSGLGSEKRSLYMNQIANSGPLEIRNFAEHATRTGDAVLGAALMSRLDGMKAADRKLTGVSRQKLAESLVGDQFAAAQSAIRTIKTTVREALAKNRSFESGKPMDARTKVGIALQRTA